MIKGISDKRRLPRLGKIRLGEKRKSSGGKMYPAALDHFNFKDVPEVEKIYGNNCKVIDVMIPVEDKDAFFEQARKAYRKSGLFCKCSDGETATRVRVGISDGQYTRVPKGQEMDPHGEKYIKASGLAVDKGDMFELPCDPDTCPFAQGERAMCKPIGRLMFLMPKVPKFGCYEISTSSINSIVQVNSSLDMIWTMAGRLSMIPLKLLLKPIEVAPDGKKKTVYAIDIVFEGDWTKFSQHRLGLPAPLTKEQLPAKSALDANSPDDLYPNGGEDLGNQVGEAPTAAAEVVDPPAPPAEEEPAQEEPPIGDPPQEATFDEAPPAEVPPAKTVPKREAAPRAAQPRAAAPRASKPRPKAAAKPAPTAKPGARQTPVGKLF